MRVLIIMLLLTSAGGLFAQSKKENTIYSTKEGAIKGYDPVAYFTENKPVKGNKTITYNWQGSVWHFSSEKNKNIFIAQPEKYAPQYGGYCAYGWAEGYAVKIEPDAWAIHEGKLYLNYDKKVQKDWDKDRAGYIKKADEKYNN
jgi:YHS domain-containing protein